MDRINNFGCLGTMIGNLYAGKLMFDIHPRIAYNLANQDFSRVLTLHQGSNEKKPGVGRYEGMLEIAGHEILVAGVAGRENGSMTLGLSSSNIINHGGERGKVLRREKAFNRIMPINFRSKCGDFDAKLTHPKMQDKRKFGKVLLSFRQQGLIDSDSFYEESEEEIKNLKEALQELKTMDISEESKLSLENVKRLIQRNCSENRLAWWDRNKIEATLKIKEECKYDSPGFLVRNHGEIKKEHIVEKIRNFPDILKDKKHLQSYLGVVNFADIFIKDLAKYRKDFRPLLKETESAKWKWEEIHTQRVCELKQVCNNLLKLAIPQDENELVVYTDANDYRWAAVLMKKTTTGEEPCRYTGGLFTEQQAQV
ncbi:UNVERIFIED_CONTAM: Polyprotein P3 [Sesamum angustifolium]|uniref:Polyprotein P3 n=1 Tax=Sesamum angustifolium TaxID=2727405 RepID=A0AAW2PRV8_9LAMI